MSNKLNSAKKNLFNQNAFILIPSLLVIIYLFVSGSIGRRNFVKKILSHSAFTTGRITSYKSAVKQTGAAVYTFSVRDSVVEGITGSGQFRKLGSAMYNHNFPVIYNSDDPRYNEILVFPNQFEEYGIAYPDNLSWVKRELDE